MPKLLTLIRGLPGSGKSTLAAKLMDSNTIHAEADQYFMVNGEYQFNASELSDAHKYCQRKVYAAMTEGKNVIVSNTFIRKWEMEPYLEMASQKGYQVQIIHCQANFGSIHNGPDEVIARMAANFEQV